MAPRRRTRIVALVGVLILLAASVVAVRLATEPTAAQRRAAAIAAARARLLARERRTVAAARRLVAATLPARSGQAAPSSTKLFAKPLAAHEVLGFVPYWELSSLTAADYADVSTLAYFGPSLTRSGGIDPDPDFGTSDYENFVRSARASGDAVLLTISTAVDPVIKSVLASPTSNADKLATEAVAYVRADGLQGVDLDVEGTVSGERLAYVTFVQAFARRLHGLDAGAQLVVDTYVDAAGQGGFFDVAPLGRAAGQLFVMGYDMVLNGQASANAPLIAPDLGLSDVQALIAYLRLVPARKLILGVPFYGYDFPTESTRLGAAATAAPDAVVYSAVATSGHRALWDAATDTPYAPYRSGASDHEIYFDDPVSIALKSALAQVLNLHGVGVWALGMESGSPLMLQALAGRTSPGRASSG